MKYNGEKAVKDAICTEKSTGTHFEVELCKNVGGCKCSEWPFRKRSESTIDGYKFCGGKTRGRFMAAVEKGSTRRNMY